MRLAALRVKTWMILVAAFSVVLAMARAGTRKSAMEA